MTIKVGDKIPSVTLRYLTPGRGEGGAAPTNSSPARRSRCSRLPGAYTRTCSQRHLPGYVTQCRRRSRPRASTRSPASRSTTPFVMGAWGKEHNAGDKIVDARRRQRRVHRGDRPRARPPSRKAWASARSAIRCWSTTASSRRCTSSRRANSASPAPRRCWRSCRIKKGDCQPLPPAAND